MESDRYKVSVCVPDALRYMGVSGAPDEATAAEMRRLAELTENCARARVIMKVLPVEHEDASVSLRGSALRLSGRAVAALLHDSESCILFCATIGDEIEALLRKWQIKDMAAAAMLDACASSAVESLCDMVEEELRCDYGVQGLFLTDRFSPGYGDLPIEVQRDFCAELDTARKIGVHVSADGIMIPRKSVTALIGVSKKKQRSREVGCEGCKLINNCKFREGKVTCYGEAI